MSLFLSLFNSPYLAVRKILQGPYSKSRRMYLLITAYMILASVLTYFSWYGKKNLILPILIFFIVPLIIYIYQYIWSFFVRFGLAIVASRHLSKEERRTRALQLKALYPYITGIGVIPFVFVIFLPRLNQPSTSAHMFLGFLYDNILFILVLALQMYKWIVSTMACREIYGVSAARAFWGPMLAIVIVSVVVGLVIIAVLVLLRLTVFH